MTMNKQHHIVYERSTDKYWFILPDDAEVEVCESAIKEIDFNNIYIKLYSLYLSDKEKYKKIKNFFKKVGIMDFKNFYNFVLNLDDRFFDYDEEIFSDEGEIQSMIPKMVERDIGEYSSDYDCSSFALTNM